MVARKFRDFYTNLSHGEGIAQNELAMVFMMIRSISKMNIDYGILSCVMYEILDLHKNEKRRRA